MAMSVGQAEEEGSSIAEINTTPLVDIMLVLLIIFLITVPVIQDMKKVEIPKAVNIPTQTKPENITISVDAAGQVYWNAAASGHPSSTRCTAVPTARAVLRSPVPSPSGQIRS